MASSSPESSPEEIWPPGRKVAGRYRITRPIGRGGMGVVYAATDEQTGGAVALKVPFAERMKDGHSQRRFAREARMATGLTHPNAVRVLAVQEDDSRPLMVMELLEGQSLTARIDEVGRLSLGEAARIVVPVLGALAEAHARGIVHRDIKPDNIFLARIGGQVVPKMLDFGVAKLVHHTADAESMKLTTTGAMLGTPYYMAPEQAAARPVFDHRVDLWAIGVVLYEALSGVRPFDGQVYGQIFAAIFGEEPPPIRDHAPELPDEVVQLIARCLRKRPEERPASAGEIAEVLARYASLPAMRYPTPGNTMHGLDGADASDPMFRARATLPDGAAPATTARSRAAGARRLAVGAAAVLVAAVIAVVWIAATSRSPGSRSAQAPAPPATPAKTAVAPASIPVMAPAAAVTVEPGTKAPPTRTTDVPRESDPSATGHAQAKSRGRPRPAAPAAQKPADGAPRGAPATGIIETL